MIKFKFYCINLGIYGNYGDIFCRLENKIKDEILEEFQSNQRYIDLV